MRRHKIRDFCSPLKLFAKSYIQEKRACGYRYDEEERKLSNFDRFLCSAGLATQELPRKLVNMWLQRRTLESTTSLKKRIRIVRQFAKYLIKRGISAHVPDPRSCRRERNRNFKPRIFTLEEIHALLRAADEIKPNPNSRLRHLIVPELFRVLYGCGLRVGEALNLKAQDVDLAMGVLTIREAKFGKDRYVPMAPSLVERLRRYSHNIDTDNSEAYFFPTPGGAAYSHGTIYRTFRDLLWQAGIPHGGRGKGPRIHDMRHSHAVHCLVRWYRQGENLSAKLAILAVYLGHKNLAGTQTYLHLTAELFPDISRRFQEAYGRIIPRIRSKQ